MPPVNDAFASYIILAGASGSVAGNNIGATLEPDPGSPFETSWSARYASVWYRWTPTTTGIAHITVDSDFDDIGIDVYVPLPGVTPATMTIQDYRYLASGFNSDDPTDIWNVRKAGVGFEAVAGMTYIIRIGSDDLGVEGNFTLTWNLTPDNATSSSARGSDWTQLPPMPSAANDLFGAIIGGKLHVLGGGDWGSRFIGTQMYETGNGQTIYSPLHRVYDPATDRWTYAAPIPDQNPIDANPWLIQDQKQGTYGPGRGEAGAALLNGKLHVLGGAYTGDAMYGTSAWHRVYDPATDSWSTAAEAPLAEMGLGYMWHGPARAFHWSRDNSVDSPSTLQIGTNLGGTGFVGAGDVVAIAFITNSGSPATPSGWDPPVYVDTQNGLTMTVFTHTITTADMAAINGAGGWQPFGPTSTIPGTYATALWWVLSAYHYNSRPETDTITVYSTTGQDPTILSVNVPSAASQSILIIGGGGGHRVHGTVGTIPQADLPAPPWAKPIAGHTSSFDLALQSIEASPSGAVNAYPRLTLFGEVIQTNTDQFHPSAVSGNVDLTHDNWDWQSFNGTTWLSVAPDASDVGWQVALAFPRTVFDPAVGLHPYQTPVAVTAGTKLYCLYSDFAGYHNPSYSLVTPGEPTNPATHYQEVHFASYNDATDTWTTLTPPPLATTFTTRSTAYQNLTSRCMMTVGSDGHIYVLIGFNNGVSNPLYRYDIATNTWTTLAPNPSLLGETGFLAKSNGKLWAIMGYDPAAPSTYGGNDIPSIMEYDIATNTWTRLADAPVAPSSTWPGGRENETVISDLSVAYIVGGSADEVGNGYYGMTEFYNALVVGLSVLAAWSIGAIGF